MQGLLPAFIQPESPDWSELPRVSAPVRSATEMIVAVKAYSMAVAPDSHFATRVQSTFIMEVPFRSLCTVPIYHRPDPINH